MDLLTTYGIFILILIWVYGKIRNYPQMAEYNSLAVWNVHHFHFWLTVALILGDEISFKKSIIIMVMWEVFEHLYNVIIYDEYFKESFYQKLNNGVFNMFGIFVGYMINRLSD